MSIKQSRFIKSLQFSEIRKLSVPILVLSFLFSAFAATVCAQQEFYIDDGRSIQKVENGDPQKIQVVEWQIRLYRVGQAKSGNNHWGLITGKSMDAVMRELKKDQDFEVRYNAWAGEGRVPNKSGSTWFNYLGPIAKVERPSASKERQDKQRLFTQENWQRIQDTINRSNDFYNGFRAIVDILSQDPTTTTPFDNVGSNFRDYMDNLVQAMERTNALRTILEDSTMPAMDKISAIINEITNSLNSVQTLAPRVARGFGLEPSVIAPPSRTTTTPPAKPATNSVSPDQIEVEMNRIMSEFEKIDPNDFEGSMRKINELARKLSNLINSDPESTADMKQLAKLLVEITGTSNFEVMAEKLEQLQQLMERINP